MSDDDCSIDECCVDVEEYDDDDDSMSSVKISEIDTKWAKENKRRRSSINQLEE